MSLPDGEIHKCLHCFHWRNIGEAHGKCEKQDDAVKFFTDTCEDSDPRAIKYHKVVRELEDLKRHRIFLTVITLGALGALVGALV